MSVQELSCQELVELVTDYVVGVLPQHDRLRFAAHVAACRGCLNYIQQMRQTIRLTGRLTEDALEPDVQRRLLDVFRTWKQE